jgi:hypothetical protein
MLVCRCRIRPTWKADRPSEGKIAWKIPHVGGINRVSEKSVAELDELAAWAKMPGILRVFQAAIRRPRGRMGREVRSRKSEYRDRKSEFRGREDVTVEK